MIDFYLNQGGVPHGCSFVRRGTLDFAAPAEFPFHNWRAVLHKGNFLLATGDVISLTPIDPDRCRLSIRSPGSYEKLSLDLSLGRPSYPGAAPEFHWLEGRLGESVIYVYLWNDDGRRALLLQRFVNGGPSEPHLPTRPGVVTYERPTASDTLPSVDSTPPEGAPLRAVGTQEDEGGGYVP